MLALTLAAHGAETRHPQWVVDPTLTGADVPQRGVSLFERLITGPDGRQEIPFPFERLLAHIEAAAGCRTDRPCTRGVLIPLGRSLQRVAAAPDFFAHPRVVAAVVDEGDGMFLRDRLYLGFQDKAGVIEVISYNEALGRFEFQIVRNFAPGRTPQIVYARRTVCIACHQNQGPIFPQPVWLETNANGQIAARLAQRQASFSGIAARGHSDISQAIDDATDRANALALTQRLWMDGCGEGESGIACRRAVVTASLQFALTGRRTYARSAPDTGLDVLRRNAATLWPAGLALAGADLPNRDPLALHEGITALQAANIDTRFDPLSPRLPAEIITIAHEDRLKDRLIRGAADFWPQRGLDALADALDRQHNSPQHRTALRCRISGRAGLEQFDCVSDRARLRGSLNGATGVIDEIAIPGSISGDEPVRHLRVDSVRRQAQSATLLVRSHGRRLRLANGNAIERIRLNRHASAAEPERGEALVDIREDFSAMTDALRGLDLQREPLNYSILDAITARLTQQRPPPIQTLATRARSDSYVPATAQSGALALQFETQCGACHHTAEITPPNFLHGDSRRVSEALRNCGPRIYVRLAMRSLPPSQRLKTPMPPEPPTIVARTHTSEPADERALMELQAAVGAALRKEYGREVSLDDLLRHGYESLRPCLPLASPSEEASHARTQT